MRMIRRLNTSMPDGKVWLFRGERYGTMNLQGKGLVLSLFDRTGNMVLPWAEAGYQCIIVDIQHEKGYSYGDHENILKLGCDVLEFQRPYDEMLRPIVPAFVAAFPPCTHLAASGAQWWKDKGLEALHEALTLVLAAKRLCELLGAPFMIENPIGRLSTLWREPDFKFDPCDFGGYLDPAGDAYTKKTCLWTGGGFLMPEKRAVKPVLGSKMAYVPASADRANIRSETPKGFARAVFLANTGQVPGVKATHEQPVTLDALGL